MTYDIAPHYPYSAPTLREGRPDSVDALVSAAGIGLVIAVDLGLTFAIRELAGRSGEVGSWVLFLAPWLAFAGLVAVRGRTMVRRLSGAGVIALVAVLVVAFERFAIPAILSRGSDSSSVFALLEHLLDAERVLITLAVVGAWGIARRRHPLWLVGLPIACGLVWGVQHLLSGQLLLPYDGLGWVVYFLLAQVPMVLGGMVCWGLDRASALLRPANLG